MTHIQFILPQPIRQGPPVRPGQFCRLENWMIRRAVPHEIGNVPVIVGLGGVIFGRVIRIVPAKNPYGSIIGTAVRLYEVAGTCGHDQQATLLDSTVVSLHSQYQSWGRNCIGGLGAIVEWPDTDGIARAIRRLATHA